MNLLAKPRRTKLPVREDLKEGYIYSIVQTNRSREMAFAPAPGQVLKAFFGERRTLGVAYLLRSARAAQGQLPICPPQLNEALGTQAETIEADECSVPVALR